MLFLSIGAVDSPVVKDSRTGRPMIPGSSLKGKMRALLAKRYNEDWIAETPDDDAECLTNLFGSAKKGKSKPYFIFRYVSGKYRRAEKCRTDKLYRS